MPSLIEPEWVPDIVLIDGMNLAKRNHFARLLLQDSEGVPMGAVHGCMEYVHTIRTKYPDATILFLWEGGESYRKEIYPEYKANRDKSGEGPFTEAIKVLQKCLKYASIPQVSCLGLEADDLAGGYSEFYKNKKVLLVSKDYDWWQYLQSGRDIKIDFGGTIYDYDKATHKLGYIPEGITLYKSLRGDPSDNIKGIPRWPDKLARHLAGMWGSDENWSILSDIEAYASSSMSDNMVNKWYQIGRDNVDTIKRIYSIVKYDGTMYSERDCDIIWLPYRSDDLLREVFEAHGLQKLLKLYGLESDI